VKLQRLLRAAFVYQSFDFGALSKWMAGAGQEEPVITGSSGRLTVRVGLAGKQALLAGR
jgi:hypothetical protein